MHDAPLREHPTDHPAFSTREPNPPWSERQTRPTPSGLQPPSGTIPERNTERQHAPPCSSLSDALQHAAPADALLRNNIPGRHIPLDPRDPSPFRRREGPEEGVRTPLRANSDPLSLLSTIQNGSAYDDHPDCAVFLVVKPPGANPTNASSPRPAPSHGLRAERERDRGPLNKALAPPWAPAT